MVCGYVVEEEVGRYLSSSCSSSPPLTGLLIGQSSAQKDFVVKATRTPQREETGPAPSGPGAGLDMEWVTEHARQVTRMLPGGLNILGVFYISDAKSEDTLSTLRQLVFAVEKSVSRDFLWGRGHDDITRRVTLHVNATSRKTFCRTFDVRDPKSTAKPADWKYQTGVCASWPMVWSCVEVEIPVSLPHPATGLEDLETSLQGGLQRWSQQIESGTFLLDGRNVSEDTELTAGQTRRNVRQTFQGQILTTPVCAGEQSPAPLRPCGGGAVLRGAVHARAYLHGNKPRARLAEKVLKRDLISTVAVRVQMILEELRAAESQDTDRQTDRLSLPQRVLCPLQGVCVCDYRFADEDLGDVVERLKEILDLDAGQEVLDAGQEVLDVGQEVEAAATGSGASQTWSLQEASMEPQKSSYLGVAVAGVVALLASSVSFFYLKTES